MVDACLIGDLFLVANGDIERPPKSIFVIFYYFIIGKKYVVKHFILNYIYTDFLFNHQLIKVQIILFSSLFLSILTCLASFTLGLYLS